MKKDNTVSVEELKTKNAGPIKRACIYTNLLYSLIEVADSLMTDVNSILKPLGAEINGTEKQKLKLLKTTGRNLKVWLHDFAIQIYELDEKESVLDDADKLYDIILLIMDRCGGQMDILEYIKASITKSFKSKYGWHD